MHFSFFLKNIFVCSLSVLHILACEINVYALMQLATCVHHSALCFTFYSSGRWGGSCCSRCCCGRRGRARSGVTGMTFSSSSVARLAAICWSGIRTTPFSKMSATSTSLCARRVGAPVCPFTIN